MRVRILSDIKGFSEAHQTNIHITFVRFDQKTLLQRVVKMISMSKGYDIFLMNFSKEIFLLGFLKLLLPVIRCKLMVLDLFVPHPGNETTIVAKLKRYLIILCIKKIDLILVFSKDNAELCKAYHIKADKVKYIPFKINSYEFVTKQTTDDRGYIFSGGQSRRDYKTLIEACKGLPYPVKIVTPNKEQAKVHGTLVDESLIPPNVEIVHDDGSIESFVSFIAHSRFVVIPTMINDFASTGTSVYLISMALKKCVVISSGPTTKGILDADLAVVVPPEDTLALRKAIVKVHTDDNYRDAVAQNGHKYALSLGGLDTLYQSMLSEIKYSYHNGDASIAELASKTSEN